MSIMTTLATAVVLFVALLHGAFLVLEMFLWSKPIGRRVFGLPAEVMRTSAPLAANQGLYNGFLSAGLIWGVTLGTAGFSIRVFFLVCVVIAGVFGAATAKRSILFIQALPGAIGLLLTYLSRS
jgi:putative membrane protein